MKGNEMGTARNVITENATARSQVYGLLAAIFRAEPTEVFLEEIKGPHFSGVFTELGVDLGNEFYDKPEAELLEDLAIEFTRLFIGPGSHISAHESVFINLDGGEGDHWGPATIAVKKFIETAGLDYEPSYAGLPDHVSVELEFLQRLAEWEAGKWSEGDAESAKGCLSVQKKFIIEHPIEWVPKFCDEVVKKTELPFYREMAKLTKSFLEYERKGIPYSEISSGPAPKCAGAPPASV